MSLVTFVGPVGTGKTLGLTYFALKDSRPICSNYWVRSARWSLLTPIVLDRIEVPTFVGIDEAYVWMESRVSSSLINRYMSYIVFQSRKRQLTIALTLQLNRTVDIRFREMADLVIECKKVDEGFAYKAIRPDKQKVVYRFLIDWKLAKQLYTFYNTWQRVSRIDRYMVAELANDPFEMNAIVDEMVAEVLKASGGRPVKKYFVEDFAVHNGFPSKFVKPVVNRLLVGGQVIT